jgi:dTDP-4-dehydrorhamnose reductase
MSNILILGNGFMGTRIYNEIKNRDKKNITDVQIISKSDLDYTKIDNLYSDDIHSPDIIINASGYTGTPNVDACEYNKSECWRLNVDVPSKLYDHCAYNGIHLIHISSGCIYTGYDKVYTEDDTPNFGMFSDESSFYSKTKHAAELLMEPHPGLLTFRIRIPFTGDDTSRNYINKLLNYDNLISMDNSITCVEEFTAMLVDLIDSRDIYSIPYGVYNACNPDPVNAESVLEIMKKYNISNPEWSIVKLTDLNIVANRSNCILSTDKIQSIGDWFKPTEESLEIAIKSLAKNLQSS